MIYARVDVSLRDHRRLSLGVAELDGEARREKRKALLGLFVWSLLYCREHKLDGAIPVPVVDDEDVPDLVRRLVEVDLWTLSADGSSYIVRNYAAKNDTAEVIEGRIAGARKRKAKSRGADVEAVDPRQLSFDDHQPGERPVTRRSRVTPGSDSHSGSGSESQTRARDPAAAEDSGDSSPAQPPFPPADERANRPGAPAPMSARILPRPPSADAPPTGPPPDIPVTDELRALCARAGWPAPTAAHAAACLANARRRGTRSVDWGAELAVWMSRERTFAGRPGPAALDDPADYRRRRDERQRQDDARERELAKARASPAFAREALRAAMEAVA